jgi:hypothetical protein
VQETITVTGETPLVDVQSSKVQQTLKQDVINALPSGRTYFGLAALVPGITTSVQDVGGIAGPSTVTFSNHGGPLTEGRLQVDGMSIGSAVGGSGVSFYVADVGHAQEIVFSTSGGLGEAEVGGPVMSLIPSTGANTIRVVLRERRTARRRVAIHAGTEGRRPACASAADRVGRERGLWRTAGEGSF